MQSKGFVRWVAGLAVAATLALSGATAGLAQTTGPYQPSPTPTPTSNAGLKKCIKHAKKKHKGNSRAKKKAIKKCRKKFG
jgi:hypothetical protein